MQTSVWLIAGPTASGKSALALRLAKAIAGEIVNADSMQLYQGISILSAAPTAAEKAEVPHHLYQVAHPSAGWSAGLWLRAAAKTLKEVGERGKPAIVVGGTGLYFRALTQGLAPIPDIPLAKRKEVADLWARGGEAAVRGRLKTEDPASAERVAPGDRQRLLRALEVLLATGRPIGSWRGEAEPVIGTKMWRGVVVSPPRASLYQRCDERLEGMVAKGALEEVGALLQRGLDPSAPAMKALGVREFARCLAGELSLEQALGEAQRSTRHYAKRQLTWFRHQTAGWPTLSALAPDDAWTGLNALWSPALRI